MFIILDYFGDNVNVELKTSQEYIDGDNLEADVEVAKFNTLKEAEEYAQDVQYPQIVNTNISKALFSPDNILEILIDLGVEKSNAISYLETYIKSKFNEE